MLPLERRSCVVGEVLMMRTSIQLLHPQPLLLYILDQCSRARARQLNYQVLSFLGNDSNVHENMMLPKLDTFVLLTNEGPSLDKRDEPYINMVCMQWKV